MSYKLFLDDVRNPEDCVHYMHKRVGPDNPLYLQEWTIVRNYDDFVNTIKQSGLPELVSFDHDLADEHYGSLQTVEGAEEHESWEGREKTGYDCAIFLLEYCYWRDLPLPKCFVHSMNAVGSERITKLLNTPMHVSIKS